MTSASTSALSNATNEELSTTTTPARGQPMRHDLLSKLRAPTLVHSWEFWHDRQERNKTDPSSKEVGVSRATSSRPGKYEDRLVHMTDVADVKAFWSMFNNFDVLALPTRDSIHLFHKGIKPIWEDPRNIRGGSWTFRVPKENAVEFWKIICMLAIGEQLQNAVSSPRTRFIDDICGVSLSIRFTSTLIQIWNRDGEHKKGIDCMLETVMDNLPENLRPNTAQAYYKKHSEHVGFNVGNTSAPVGSADSPMGPSLTAASNLRDGPSMPPRTQSSQETLSAVNEEESDQTKHSPTMAPIGITPTLKSEGGPLSDGEAIQDVEESLGDMKDAFDRVAGNDQ